MPHITIDTSALLAKSIDWLEVLQGLHEEMAARGWATLNDMKSRVHANHAALAGSDATALQLVATLAMTNPRPKEVQQAMAEAVMRHLSRAIQSRHHLQWVQCCVIVTEIPKDCYLKQQWNLPTT